MQHHSLPATAQIIAGPCGMILTRETLPPTTTTRWVCRKKAEIVLAVRAAMLSEQEVTELYNISLEELHEWQMQYHKSGLKGLQVTKHS